MLSGTAGCVCRITRFLPLKRRLSAHPQPPHFLLQSVIVVTGVYHDCCAVLAVEKDVRHPFPHTGNIFINPARIQRLEYFFATIHHSHSFSLKFGCFFMLSSFHNFCICQFYVLRQINRVVISDFRIGIHRLKPHFPPHGTCRSCGSFLLIRLY